MKNKTALCLFWIAMSGAVFAAEPPAGRPKIAIVIDDFGLTYPKNVPDEEWMKLPFPMTFADMPKSPRTKTAAEATRAAGKELIIHFPFDPFLKLDLDPNRATEEDQRKIRRLLDDAVASIPEAVGMNNHRSYKATRNRPLMRWFMGEFKRRYPKFFFVDSKVSGKTVAYDEARREGIPTALNTIFLEDDKHHAPEFTEQMLRFAAKRARKNGSALVIGHHYFRGTYEGIKTEAPKLQQEGFEFVFASDVVR